MRTFIKYFSLFLFLLTFNVASLQATETKSVVEPISLYETIEFQVFNRTLSSDKETCTATNGSLMPLGALGSSQTMLEYTAPAKSTGCVTGTIVLVENSKVKNLIERDRNFEAHLATMESAKLKESREKIDHDAKVQMLGADNDKGIDWGVVHICIINKGNYLSYRDTRHGDGLPVLVFFYGKDQGEANEDSCPESSYVVVTQSQFTQIFGSVTVLEKAIPSQPVANPFQERTSPAPVLVDEPVGPDDEEVISEEPPAAKPKAKLEKKKKKLKKKK